MSEKVIGVIGGSGLYEMEGLVDVKEIVVSTPFGEPSDVYITGTLDGVKMVFLPRHGRGHRYLPSEVNYRANIYGMKKLGVEQIISVSAVGSLKEEIVPGHIVIPDQFIDRTMGRIGTFFGRGAVAHVGFAHPLCQPLSALAGEVAKELGARVHMGGTYVCMEGPQFSTLAESKLYRSWGADIIGMTNLQEAKLAMEAEIAYSTMALVTDYDCWHPDHDAVTVEMIIDNLTQNARAAQQVIAGTVERLDVTMRVPAHSALKTALITRPDAIPDAMKRDLAPLIGKYIK